MGKHLALFGGAFKPIGGLGLVLAHATTGFIHEAQRVLGAGQSLLGSLAIQLERLTNIFRHTLAGLVQFTESKSCFRIPLFGRLAVPIGGIEVTVSNIFSSGVQSAKLRLCLGVPALRSRAKGGHVDGS